MREYSHHHTNDITDIPCFLYFFVQKSFNGIRLKTKTKKKSNNIKLNQHKKDAGENNTRKIFMICVWIYICKL